MASKRDKDIEKKEEAVRYLSTRPTEDLLKLRNLHREGKANKYWRVALKEVLTTRGVMADE